MAKKRANGEGTIRKRSDNCWEARYSVDGKRHSLFAKSQKEARKVLTEVMSTIDNGEYLEETEMSVAQWMQTWTRDFLGSVKIGTKEGYEAVVKNHIIPCLGSIRMKDLQLLTVQRFVNRLSEKGMNPKTVKNVHGILHRGLQMAVRIGYLKKNPSDGIILPRIEQEEVHPLDKPELSKLLKSIQGHEHEVLINTAIFTGMRSGELLGLTWDCVDFDRGVIYVKKQLLQSRKKEDGFRFGTPKNGKGRVIMPAPFLMKMLKRHKTVQASRKLALGPAWNDGDFPNLVFTHPDGSHLSQASVWKILYKMLKNADLPHYRFHDLRHTYVVTSIHAGDDPKAVSTNAGHYSVAFTLDRYGHFMDSMRKESSERMEQFRMSL